MGLLDFFAKRIKRQKRAPQRETETYPRLLQLGTIYNQKSQVKPSPPNLRYFSRTPYARRAIRCIREPICTLRWQIVPIEGVKMNKELEKQARIVTDCLEHPNTVDSWRSLIGMTIEDMLVFGGGAIEQQISSDENRPLWLWPVDTQSIQIYAGWQGSKTEPRYCQVIGYTNIGFFQGRDLRNDELIFILTNSSTETPYGIGALEVAFQSVNRILGATQYAGNLASNAQPQSILMIEKASAEQLRTLRNYWRDEVEGQGVTPMLGGFGESKILQVHPGGDNALYLKYQEFVIREIATAFGLSPHKMGIERDVNRSTAEISRDADWDDTIVPTAELIESYITREAIQKRLGFYQLQFQFEGLRRQDEKNIADVFAQNYKSNLMTPNEQRIKQGMEPLDNQFADLLFADVQIATTAARGSAIIDDKDLDSNQTTPTKKPKNTDKNKEKGKPKDLSQTDNE